MARVESTPTPGNGGLESPSSSENPTIAAELKQGVEQNGGLPNPTEIALQSSSSGGSGDDVSLLDTADFDAMDAPSPDAGSGSQGSASGDVVIVQAFDARSGEDIPVTDLSFMYDASFMRQGSDLLLVKADGTAILIENYFAVDTQPDLTGEMGRRLTPELVDSFLMPTAPGQTAALDGDQLAQVQGESIGAIDTLTGEVFAVRPDGTRVLLEAGDPVFQGDQVETGDGSSIKITFADGTIFTLGAEAKLALDEMVYDPGTQSGSSAFSILKGGFLFVSGQIAQSNPNDMQVTTPVATIGIRGTIVTGEVPGLTTADGETFRFTVVDGEIAVAAGNQTIVLSDNFSSVSGQSDESGGLRVLQFQETPQNVIARNSRQFKALSQEDIQKIETAVQDSIREQTGETVTLDLNEIVESVPEERVIEDDAGDDSGDEEFDGEVDDETQQLPPDENLDDTGEAEDTGEEQLVEDELLDEELLEEELTEEELAEEELQDEDGEEEFAEEGEEFAAGSELGEEGPGPEQGPGDDDFGDEDFGDDDLAGLDGGEEAGGPDLDDPEFDELGPEEPGPDDSGSDELGAEDGGPEDSPNQELNNVIVGQNQPQTAPTPPPTNIGGNTGADEIINIIQNSGQQSGQQGGNVGDNGDDDDDIIILDEDLFGDDDGAIEVGLSDFSSDGNQGLTFDGSDETSDLVLNHGNASVNLTVATGTGNDEVNTGSGDDDVDTGDGDDTIKTGDGDDVVNAGAGDDTIVGGTGNGNDTYRGDEGDDIVTYDSVTGTLTTSLSATLSATDALSFVQDNGSLSVIGIDTLTGIEDIRLGDGDDTISVNTLEINVDADEGFDTLRFDNLSGGVNYDFDSGVAFNASASGTFTSIEEFVGSSGDDNVTISSIDHESDGGSGTNTLTVRDITGEEISLSGSSVSVIDSSDSRILTTHTNYQKVVLSDADDTLEVDLNSFGAVDGGAGDDTLQLAASGSSVSVTLGDNVSGFETLDLTGFTANAGSVFTMSYTDTQILNNTDDGTLTVIGADAGEFNVLQTSSSWESEGIDQQGFTTFRSIDNDAVLRLSANALAGASGASTFNGAVDDQWSTAGNWTDVFTGIGGAPTNGGIAVLNTPGELIDFSGVGTLSLESLTGSGTLVVQDGKLNVNDPISLSERVDVFGFAELQLANGGSIEELSLDRSSNLVLTSGVLTVSEFGYDSTDSTLTSAAIEGDGTLLVTDEGDFNGTLDVEGKLIIGETATVDISEFSVITHSQGSLGQVINNGTINAQSVALDNAVNNGVINFTDSGTFSVLAGNVDLQDGALNVIDTSLVLSGGTLSYNGGDLNLDDSDLLITLGGNLAIGAGQTLTNNETSGFLVSDGEISGAGVFANSGTIELAGETISVATFVNTGQIDFGANETMTLDGGILDTRDGTIEATEAGAISVEEGRVIFGTDTLIQGVSQEQFAIRIGTNSVLEIGAGETNVIDGGGADIQFVTDNGTLELNGDMVNNSTLTSFQSGTRTRITGDGTLTNTGAITFDSEIIDANIVNTGTLVIDSSEGRTTEFNGNVTQSSHLNLNSGAQLGGTGTLVNTGTLDFSESGATISTLTLDITDGTLEADDISDVLTLEDVNLLVGADTEVGSFGTLNINSSTISVASGETATVDQEQVLSEVDSELSDGTTATRTKPDILQFDNGKYAVSWHDGAGVQLAILDTDGTTVLSNGLFANVVHNDHPVQVLHREDGASGDDVVLAMANNSFISFGTFDSTGSSVTGPSGGFEVDFISYDVTELGAAGSVTGVVAARITSAGTVFLDLALDVDNFNNPTSIQIDTLIGANVVGDIQVTTLNNGKIASICSVDNGGTPQLNVRLTDISDPQAPVTIVVLNQVDSTMSGAVDVAALTNGNFVTIYKSSSGLVVNNYRATDGSLVSTENLDIGGVVPSNPQIIPLPGNKFRVLYEAEGSGTGTDLFSRDFSADDLLPRGDIITVANDVGNQTDAAIAVGADTDDSVVIYTGPGSSGEDLFIAGTSGAVITDGMDINLTNTTIDGPGLLQNDGTLSVDNVTVATTGELENNDTLVVGSGGMVIDGILQNDGRIANSGVLNINGTFTNNDTIDLGDAVISGTLNNNSTLQSLGSSGETITIDGVVNQSGVLELGSGGQISGSGTIVNTGTIDFSATGAELTGVTVDMRNGEMTADDASDTVTLTDATVLVGENTEIGDLGTVSIGGNSTFKISAGETVTIESANVTDTVLSDGDQDTRGAPTVERLSDGRFASVWIEDGVNTGVMLDTDGETVVDTFVFGSNSLPPTIIPDETGGGFVLVSSNSGSLNFHQVTSSGNTFNGSTVGFSTVESIHATTLIDDGSQIGLVVGTSFSNNNLVSLSIFQGFDVFTREEVVLDNTLTGDILGDVRLDTLNNGNIVASFIKDDNGTKVQKVVMASFTDPTDPVATSAVSILVSATDSDFTGSVDVAALTGGGFVVVSPLATGIFARGFDSAGSPLFSSQLSTDASTPDNPQVIALGDGSFRVLYEGQTESDGTDLFYRDYSATDGTPTSSETLIAGGAGNQTEVAAALGSTDADMVAVFSGPDDDILLAGTTSGATTTAVLSLENGTTIEGPGVLEIDSELAVDGVTIGTSGVVDNDGTLSIGTNGLVIDGTLINDAELVNGGTVTVNSGGTLVNNSTLDLSSGGFVINGVFDNSNGALAISDAALTLSSGASTLDGTLTLTGGAGLETNGGTGTVTLDGVLTSNNENDDDTISANLIIGSGGQVVVGGANGADGTLNITGDFTNNGIVHVDPETNSNVNGVLNVSQDFDNTGTIIVDNAATLSVGGGSGTITNTGLITGKTSGILETGVIEGGKILNTGTITAPGATEVGATLTFDGMVVDSLNGTISVQAGGELIFDESTLMLGTDSELDMNGGILGLTGNGAVLNLGAGLTVTNGGDVSISLADGSELGGSGTLVNHRQMDLDDVTIGANATLLNEEQVEGDDGTISVSSEGTLTINGAVISDEDAAILVENGGVLAGTGTVTDHGTFQASGVTIDTGLTYSGDVELSSFDALVLNGTLTGTLAERSGSGASVTGDGQLNLTDLIVQGSSLQFSSAVDTVLDGDVTFSDAGGRMQMVGSDLVLTDNTDFTDTNGTITINGGARLGVEEDNAFSYNSNTMARLDIGNGGSSEIFGDGTFNNSLSSTLTTAGDVTVTIASFTNSGVLEVDSNNLNIDTTGFTNVATIEVTSGAADGALVFEESTTVGGTIALDTSTGAAANTVSSTLESAAGETLTLEGVLLSDDSEGNGADAHTLSGTIISTGLVDLSHDLNVATLSALDLSNAELAFSSEMTLSVDGDLILGTDTSLTGSSSGVISINGGDLAVAAGETFTTSSQEIRVQNGVVGGDGKIIHSGDEMTFGGSSRISVDTFVSDSLITVDSGTLAITTGGFENVGDDAQQPIGTIAIEHFSDEIAALDVQADFANDGVILLTGDNGGAKLFTSGTTTLTNDGSGVIRSTTSGGSGDRVIDIDINNFGTLDLLVDTSLTDGHILDTRQGNLNIADGGTFSVAGTLMLNDDTVLGETGLVSIDNAIRVETGETFTFDGSTGTVGTVGTNGMVFSMADGSSMIGAGKFINTGDLILNNVSILSGEFENTGEITISEGTTTLGVVGAVDNDNGRIEVNVSGQNGVELQVTQPTTLGGTLVLDIVGAGNDDATLTIDSSLTITGEMVSRDTVEAGLSHEVNGHLINNGTLSVEAELNINDTLDSRDGRIGFENGAILDVDGDLLVGEDTTIGGEGTIHLGTAGVLDIAAGETFTIDDNTITTIFDFDSGADLTGTGVLRVNGTMDVTGADIDIGGLINDGLMTVSGPTTDLSVTSGVIAGEGTLHLASSEVTASTLNLTGNITNDIPHRIELTGVDGGSSRSSVLTSSTGATLTNAGTITGGDSQTEHEFDLDIVNTGKILLQDSFVLTAGHTLDATSGTLDVASGESGDIEGTLVIGGGDNLSAEFAIKDGGVLVVGTGETFTHDAELVSFDFSSGSEIAGPGTFKNTSDFTISNVEFGSTAIIENDGTAIVSGNSEAIITTANFDNSEGVIRVHADDQSDTTLTVNADLTNAGTIEIMAEDGNGTGTATVQTDSSGRIINTGTLSTGGGLFGGGQISVLLNVVNTGLVSIFATTSFASGAVLDTTDGQLEVTQNDFGQGQGETVLSFASGSTLVVGSDTEIDRAPGDFTLSAGTIDIGAGAVLELATGETFTNDVTSPLMDLGGGGSIAGTGGLINNGELNLANASIASTINIDNNQNLNIVDGTLTLNSDILNNDDGTIKIVGSNSKALLDLDIDFTNNGTISVFVLGENAGIRDVSSGGILLTNNGTLNFEGGSFGGSGVGLLAVDVVNTGTITVDGFVRVQDNAHLDTTNGALLVDNPTEDVNERLTIRSDSTLSVGSDTNLAGSGTVRLGNGSTLNVNAGENFVYEDGDAFLEFESQGTPTTNVAFTGAGTFTNEDELSLSSEVTLSIDTFINKGTLDSLDGTLTFDGTNLEIQTGGDIDASVLTGTGSVTNNSPASLIVTGQTITGGLTYLNNAQIAMSSGFAVGAASVFTNAAAATVSYDSGKLDIDGSFVNDGLLQVSGGTSDGSGTLTNNGQLTVNAQFSGINADLSVFTLDNSGTLSLLGGGNGSATLSVNEMDNSGVIDFTANGSGASTRLNIFADGTGTMTNNGLIQSSNNSVETNGLNTIDGTVQAGASGGTIHVGENNTLTVDTVVLNEQSRVIIETGAGGSDGATLNIVDGISYAGSLEVRIDDAFATGYNLISASSFDSSFHRILLKNADGSEDFDGVTGGDLAIPDVSGASFSLQPAETQGGLLGGLLQIIDEVVTGLVGDDIFTSGDDGASTWFGLSGNDSFTLEAGASIDFLDGGSGGADILFVEEEDFGQADAWRFNNLEALDIGGAGAGTIAINSDFVFGASEDLNSILSGLGVSDDLKDDALIIAGIAGQTLDLSAEEGDWTSTGVTASVDAGNGSGSQSYAIYSANNGADIYVDTDVDVQLISGIA